MKDKKTIDRIEFVQQSIDNAVRGKAKKGGVKLKPNTLLCKVYCKDELVYSIVACIRSQLIEINKKLINNPQLITSDVSRFKVDKIRFNYFYFTFQTWSKGYIAIVQQYQNDQIENDKTLLDYDQYNEQLKI